MKFDFFDHPSDVELSIIEMLQSPVPSLFSMMSTHGLITVARCSSRLFDAQNYKFKGM